MPYKDPEVRKQKSKGYSRKHYEANKTAVKARSAVQRKSFQKQWEEFKSKQVCIKCGFSHPAAIDFHHVEYHPSNRKLHKLLGNRSFKSALEGVQKCVPMCANCHRIHHFEERGLTRKQRLSLRKRKKPI